MTDKPSIIKVIELNVGGKCITVTEKIENMFFKQWVANKHNVRLVEHDYNLALMYFDIGYSLGFHYGYVARKKKQS